MASRLPEHPWRSKRFRLKHLRKLDQIRKRREASSKRAFYFLETRDTDDFLTGKFDEHDLAELNQNITNRHSAKRSDPYNGAINIK